MSKEITLVTAFFNIGRENYKAIPRPDSKYMKDFEGWARLRNNLIVYTQPEMKDLILAIRDKFGLKEKTIIIEIEDIYSIEPEILEKMRRISIDKYFLDFRYLPNATSNISEYSYLMLLKSYFVKDAVERKLTSEQVAWIDFGFNHGGDLYIDPQEFDFEWNYKFENKIYYFYYKKYDDRPVFEIVRRLSDCIMGCLIIIPACLANDLWILNRNAMETLNDVGLIDDDQLIHLMSYRKKPEIFKMVESEWFLPLKIYGGDNLTKLREKNNNGVMNADRHIKHYLKKIKLSLRNAILLYKNLME